MVRNPLIAAAVLAAAAGSAHAQSWAQAETFDAYGSGSMISSNPGWRPWDGVNSSDATVSNVMSLSGPNSLQVNGSSSGPVTDVVITYNLSAVHALITAYQYISSAATGADTYFIVMDTYNEGGAKHWATQVRFDLGSNTVYDNLTGTSASLPLIRDRWVPITVDVDLVNNQQTVTYDGNVLFSAAWLRYGGGNATVAAVDLYGSSISQVFYDNVGVGNVPATGPSSIMSAGLLIAGSVRRRRETA